LQFKKEIIVSFIIIFRTLSFPISNARRNAPAINHELELPSFRQTAIRNLADSAACATKTSGSGK